jgi:hypothetical protein
MFYGLLGCKPFHIGLHLQGPIVGPFRIERLAIPNQDYICYFRATKGKKKSLIGPGFCLLILELP